MTDREKKELLEQYQGEFDNEIFKGQVEDVYLFYSYEDNQTYEICCEFSLDDDELYEAIEESIEAGHDKLYEELERFLAPYDKEFEENLIRAREAIKSDADSVNYWYSRVFKASVDFYDGGFMPPGVCIEGHNYIYKETDKIPDGEEILKIMKKSIEAGEELLYDEFKGNLEEWESKPGIIY